MTANERFERELPELLADLYQVSAPDYRDSLVHQIAATRQRPGWAFPERWIPMRALELGRATRPLPWRTIGLVALLLLALAAAVIFAGSSKRLLPPPFGPAGNGQLVTAEAGDIYLISPDTGAKTLVIGGPGVDTEPRFSRDGTRIAYFRASDDGRSLWVADDRGAGARELSTVGLADISQIEWSPDGTSILLTTTVDGVTSPAIVPTDGSAARVLDPDMPIEAPIWLPNGDVLFRGIPPTGFGLFSMGQDGSGLRTVVPATGINEWDALFFGPSPDGTQIAYQWRDGSGWMFIYLVPVAGGERHAITSVESVFASWSPDGKSIAFFSDDGPYVVRADGTGQRRLTDSPPPSWTRWTPDGSRLLYMEDGATDQVLLDPMGGAAIKAPWTGMELPDWQRLAPPR
jgi:dipeptidyl aminopeptidase/acylaminoacyl peptidase